MMSDLMREEFHAEFVKRFGFGRLLAGANADAGQMLKAAEWAWQASREALVIELPKEEDYVRESETAMFFLLEDVKEAIHAAGVKTK